MSHIQTVKEGQTNLVLPDLLHTGGLWSTSQDLYRAEIERAQTAANYRLQQYPGAGRQAIPTRQLAGPYVVPGGHRQAANTLQTRHAAPGPYRNLFGGQTRGNHQDRPRTGVSDARQQIQPLSVQSLLQTQSLANLSGMFEDYSKSMRPATQDKDLSRNVQTTSASSQSAHPAAIGNSEPVGTEAQAKEGVMYDLHDEFDPIPSDYQSSTPIRDPRTVERCNWEITSGGSSLCTPDISAVGPMPQSAVMRDYGYASSRPVAVPTSTAGVGQASAAVAGSTSLSQAGQIVAGAPQAWKARLEAALLAVQGIGHTVNPNAREGLAQHSTDVSVSWLGSQLNTAPYRPSGMGPVAARMGRLDCEEQPSFEDIKELTDLENDSDKVKGDHDAGFYAEMNRRIRNRRLRLKLTEVMDRLTWANAPVFILADKMKPLKPYIISGWISDDYLLALLQKPNLINQMFGNALDSLDQIRKDVVEKCSKRNPVVFTRELVYRVFTLGELENTGMKFMKLSRRKMGAVRRCVQMQFPEMTPHVWSSSCLWKLKCHMTFILSKRVKRVQAFWLEESKKSPMAVSS